LWATTTNWNGTLYNTSGLWTTTTNWNGTIYNVNLPAEPVVNNQTPVDTSQLSSNLTQLCINISDDNGDLMSWSIWQNDVWLAGTNYSYPTHLYNYSDHINNTARWESSPTPLRMTSETIFNLSSYANITNIDALNVTTNSSTWDWSHHHFIFNLTEPEINVTGIQINWHGYAGYNNGGAKPKGYWDATMYAKESGVWTSEASTPVPYTGAPVLEWLNFSTTSYAQIHDIITGDQIEVAIENTNAGSLYSTVYTDYIEINITYRSGGDPDGTYCTNDTSWWTDDCEQIWYWNVTVSDGHYFTDETYWFENPPCILSGYVYPADNATDICPCCDSMCMGIGELYDRVNLTFYRHGEYEPSFYMVENFVNVTNGTYCFCLDGRIDGGMYWPMRYNTTYYWYAYVENCANSSLNITSSTYQFTTAMEKCECGDAAGRGEIVTNSRPYSIIGIIGLLGLFGFLIGRKKKRRNEY